MTLKLKPFNVTESNLPVLVTKLQDLMKEYPVGHLQVIIKERSSDRSVEQNARLWDLYTSIANYLGYTAQEMHELMSYNFLSTSKMVGNRNIITITSTTKLSTKEMADYMTKIEAWAANLGWSYE